MIQPRGSREQIPYGFLSQKIMGNSYDPAPWLPGANSIWILIENASETVSIQPRSSREQIPYFVDRKLMANCKDPAPGLPGANSLLFSIWKERHGNFYKESSYENAHS